MTFRQLCQRARALGAPRLIFSNAETEDDWTCVGGSLHGECAVGIAHGQTGKEALENLIAKLEKGDRMHDW